ncbi:hypothetical protein ACSBR2_026256 [Camellia fascicularis]
MGLTVLQGQYQCQKFPGEMQNMFKEFKNLVFASFFFHFLIYVITVKSFLLIPLHILLNI